MSAANMKETTWMHAVLNVFLLLKRFDRANQAAIMHYMSNRNK